MQRSGIFYILSGVISIGILLQLFYMNKIYELAPKYASNCEIQCQENKIKCTSNFTMDNNDDNKCKKYKSCGYWDESLNSCFESKLENGECSKPNFGILGVYWGCFGGQVLVFLILFSLGIYYHDKNLPIKIGGEDSNT